MTQPNGTTLLRVATTLLVVGALAWLLKLVAITMAESGDGATVSILWLLGFLGMLAGAALLGVWLVRRQNLALRVGAGLVGAVTFFMSMNIIDSLMKSLTDGAGPSHLEEEWGIFAAAALWLGVGLAARARLRDGAAHHEPAET
jgi:hypothetical protein